MHRERGNFHLRSPPCEKAGYYCIPGGELYWRRFLIQLMADHRISISYTAADRSK